MSNLNKGIITSLEGKDAKTVPRISQNLEIQSLFAATDYLNLLH